MKDGEGQLVTNTWTVTESLNPSHFSSGLPNEFASLPSFHVCSAAKWVSNGPRRELTEIEKKSTGTCYAPGGIYITGTIMSEGEQELCSVFRLNRPSKWEMTLVF